MHIHPTVAEYMPTLLGNLERADGVRAIPPARSTGQEILRAMSGAMRQIEDELIEGHEVLTREPAPVLIGSRWLLRGAG
jgi:hypothetical protein